MSGSYSGRRIDLGQPDPHARRESQSGNGGFNTQFGSTSVVASITGNLGASPANQSHTLTYSSPANGFDANSPGGSAITGGDEVAVRLGIACTLTGQTAGTYPGPGGRTARATTATSSTSS